MTRTGEAKLAGLPRRSVMQMPVGQPQRAGDFQVPFVKSGNPVSKLQIKRQLPSGQVNDGQAGCLARNRQEISILRPLLRARSFLEVSVVLRSLVRT